MAERFYLAVSPQGDLARLTGDEAHHVARVLRLGPGNELTLFDGHGREYSGRITRADRHEVEVRIERTVQVDRELPGRLTLAVALPKGDRQRWLLEKLVELGAHRLVPLVCERGVARPTSSAIERLRRAVIEATKQCGRARLLEIAEPATWSELRGAAQADEPLRRVRHYVAHPPIDTQGENVSWTGPADLLAARDESVWVAIGPEGGFTPDEFREAVGEGWLPLALGARRLRVETAATTVAVLFAAAQREIGT